MSEKKIFIGLSPEEARLVVKACRFTVWKINEQQAKEIEFTTANHAELLEFYERLEKLADEQAALEMILRGQYPAFINSIHS